MVKVLARARSGWFAPVIFVAACFSTTDPNGSSSAASSHGAAGSSGKRASMSTPDGTAGKTSVAGKDGKTVVSAGTGGTGVPIVGSGGTATPRDTTPPSVNPDAVDQGVCARAGRCEALTAAPADAVDLLFMIDNSDSMAEEQATLKAQFPRMIQRLTTGDLDGDGLPEHMPASDVHLGVVNSDMGLPGVSGILGCSGLGHDGILQNQPAARVDGCQLSYPPFLSYTPGNVAPEAIAKAFQCVATVGTGGCGFEHQLEAVLKALWPAVDPGAKGGPNRIQFLSDPATGLGTLGHGDNENQGFLRSDRQPPSALAVVILSDEDDCSAADTRPFTPAQYLPENDPLVMQSMNLRCYYNQSALYPIERYVNGLKALRPGREDKVIFAAIVGVPEDLAPAMLVSGLSSDAERDKFYKTMLDDPRMQQAIDTLGTPDPTDDRLVRSCSGANGRTAYPPARLIQTARQFGENGIVQSICGDDYAPAIDLISARIAGKLDSGGCVRAPLARDAQNLVACDVLWALPPQPLAPIGTPVSCNDSSRPFLRAHTRGQQVDARGGEICELAQLAVEFTHDAPDSFDLAPAMFNGMTLSEGWYYDDASSDAAVCSPARARIVFTSAAQPPTGVRVMLDCSR